MIGVKFNWRYNFFDKVFLNALEINTSQATCQRMQNTQLFLEVKIPKCEQSTLETLINYFFLKPRAFYPLNESSGSNITRDIIFFDEDRTLNSDNKHFTNDVPTHAETQIFPCKNIKFT